MPPDRIAAGGTGMAVTASEPRLTRQSLFSRRRDHLALAGSAGLHLLVISATLGVVHVRPMVQQGAERSVTIVFEPTLTPATTEVSTPATVTPRLGSTQAMLTPVAPFQPIPPQEEASPVPESVPPTATKLPAPPEVPAMPPTVEAAPPLPEAQPPLVSTSSLPPEPTLLAPAELPAQKRAASPPPPSPPPVHKQLLLPRPTHESASQPHPRQRPNPAPSRQPTAEAPVTGADQPLLSAPESTEPAFHSPAATSAPSVTVQPTPGWDSLISAWLASHKSYPEGARSRGEEGEVVVRFTVAPDGRVLGVEVVRGSGSAPLDDAARAVLAGARVPPPQVQLTRTVRLRYRLE